MRTTPEENKKMGQWIANALNKCEGEVRVVIPEKGISMLDKVRALFTHVRTNYQRREMHFTILLQIRRCLMPCPIL